MTEQLRYDFDSMIASVLDNATVRNHHLPYLAVDECLNHPLVNKTIVRLCNLDLVCSAGPLWNQRRVRSDGSVLYVMGGVPKGHISPTDYGNPEKHAAWDDQQVAHCLLGQLMNKKVVLLTENTKLDRFGLRRLLRDLIGPKLDDRVSLTGLFKRGKTSYQGYCDRISVLCTANEFTWGYAEILI